MDKCPDYAKLIRFRDTQRYMLGEKKKKKKKKKGGWEYK